MPEMTPERIAEIRLKFSTWTVQPNCECRTCLAVHLLAEVAEVERLRAENAELRNLFIELVTFVCPYSLTNRRHTAYYDCVDRFETLTGMAVKPSLEPKP